MRDIVETDVLPMRKEADHLHMKALVTALPVRLKLLDVAGSEAHVQTFGPGPCNGEAAAAGSVAALGNNPLQCWLIYEPGHYEVLSPAEGYKNIESLPDASRTP